MVEGLSSNFKRGPWTRSAFSSALACVMLLSACSGVSAQVVLPTSIDNIQWTLPNILIVVAVGVVVLSAIGIGIYCCCRRGRGHGHLDDFESPKKGTVGDKHLDIAKEDGALPQNRNGRVDSKPPMDGMSNGAAISPKSNGKGDKYGTMERRAGTADNDSKQAKRLTSDPNGGNNNAPGSRKRTNSGRRYIRDPLVNEGADEGPIVEPGHIEPAHYDYSCSGCGKADVEFTGARHHCKVCMNYDLCQKCYDEGVQTHEHSVTHTMEPIEPAIHMGVTCRGCGIKNFPGVRFKCDYELNYDLCMLCFDDNICTAGHTVDHIMTGYNRPRRGLIRFEAKHLHRVELLGVGTGGKVWKGEAILPNSQKIIVAIKDVEFHSAEDVRAFTGELSLMAEFQENCIVDVIGFSILDKNLGHQLSIVMEFMEKGSLFHLLHKSKERISVMHRMRMARHIARGLVTLHSKNVIHRDMKSLNILISKDYTAKLADFGVSRLVDTTHMTLAGTPAWMAPEVFTGKYTLAADIFGFGVVLYELIHCELPAREPKSNSVTVPPNTLLSGIIEDCCNQDPDKRPTAKEVLDRLEAVYQHLLTKAIGLLKDKMNMPDLSFWEAYKDILLQLEPDKLDKLFMEALAHDAPNRNTQNRQSRTKSSGIDTKQQQQQQQQQGNDRSSTYTTSSSTNGTSSSSGGQQVQQGSTGNGSGSGSPFGGAGGSRSVGGLAGSAAGTAGSQANRSSRTYSLADKNMPAP